jgi:hypothetical protein
MKDLPLVEYARPIAEAEEARGGRPAAVRLAEVAAMSEADRVACEELLLPWDNTDE